MDLESFIVYLKKKLNPSQSEINDIVFYVYKDKVIL
jgi:hypothetical protein